MLDCITPWNLIWNFFNAHQCNEIYELTTLTEPFSFLEYLPFFLKTFVLELPIYFLFLRTLKNVPVILKVNTVLNLATHPVVFFTIPLILTQLNATYLHYLVVAEIFAPLVEALVLFKVYKISLGRAVLAALCANLFSWSVGIYWT